MERFSSRIDIFGEYDEMSKPIIALIVLGVILFVITLFIGVDALMCEPPCV